MSKYKPIYTLATGCAIGVALGIFIGKTMAKKKPNDCACRRQDTRHEKIMKKIKEIEIKDEGTTVLYGGKDCGYVIYYISDLRDITTNDSGYYVGPYMDDGEYGAPIRSIYHMGFYKRPNIFHFEDLASAVATYLDCIDNH